jgi:hypothetical protein
VGVPYQAQVVDANRFVTPAWRPFFDRLDKAVGGAGSGDAPALMLGAMSGGVDEAVDAALAELVSFRPAPTPLPTFASKSVVYADATGALAGNVNGLAWDHVNLRLGINRSTPGYPLEVRGTPVDIGYMISARPTAANNCFIQMIANGAANAAGFAFTNLSLTGEWRMFMLGNTSNCLRFAFDSTPLFWFAQSLNVILGPGATLKEPASGTYTFVIQNGTAPGNLATDTSLLYAADVTTSELFAKNEANEVTRITGDMQLPSGRLLRFGGTAATEVALKRATTTLEVRLADDSAYAELRALRAIVDAGERVEFSGRSRVTSPADGNLLVTDAAAATFGRLQFGGTSASFPALKRAAAVLEAKLADDSAYTDARAFALRITDGAFLVRAEAALTDGAGAAAGTLTNAPTAGDPTKWIPVDDNGTTRYVPAW